MIIRRRNGPYTIVANRIAEDDRLSFEDVGMLTYLLSRPDNWRVHTAQLSGRGGCGRDKTRKIMANLIDAGYIRREQMRSDDGKRIEGVAYVVYDEPQQARSDDEQGTDFQGLDGQETDYQGPENQGPENPSPYKRIIDNNTGLSTKAEREGARETREDEAYRPEGLTKRAEALFYRSFKGWDRFDVDPKAPMLKAWAKLSWPDMEASADAVPRYLAATRAAGMKYAKAISTFLDLTERLWEGFPPEPAPAAPATLEAKPFGPLWNAINLRDMRLTAPQPAPPPTADYISMLVAEDSERGRRERLRRQAEYGWPMVNHRYRQAQSRKGFTARAEDVWLQSLMEAVKVNSPTMAAWREFYEAEGMPWVPDWGDMRVVFFPAGGPQALGAFEQALREAGNDAGRTQAA